MATLYHKRLDKFLSGELKKASLAETIVYEMLAESFDKTAFRASWVNLSDDQKSSMLEKLIISTSDNLGSYYPHHDAQPSKESLDIAKYYMAGITGDDRQKTYVELYDDCALKIDRLCEQRLNKRIAKLIMQVDAQLFNQKHGIRLGDHTTYDEKTLLATKEMLLNALIGEEVLNTTPE
jgi:hypothetical protein